MTRKPARVAARALKRVLLAEGYRPSPPSPSVPFRLPRGPHIVDLSQPGLAILKRKRDGRRVAVISRAAYEELVSSRPPAPRRPS